MEGKIMKKKLAILVAVMLVISLALTACGAGKAEAEAPAAAAEKKMYHFLFLPFTKFRSLAETSSAVPHSPAPSRTADRAAARHFCPSYSLRLSPGSG